MVRAWGGGDYGDIGCVFFFSSRRRHTRFDCDWSSDVCSSDLSGIEALLPVEEIPAFRAVELEGSSCLLDTGVRVLDLLVVGHRPATRRRKPFQDRKSVV